MSEKELQQVVVDMARHLGWRVCHFRPAQTAKGWRTPVQYDGKGFPDLVLAHSGGGRHGPRRGCVIFCELKASGGSLSAEQQEWRSVLQAARSDFMRVEVWEPTDLDTGRIEVVLRRGADA